MATQKRLNARIIPKHDTEINWNKAINFIPLKGEIIVYDADENYSYPRIKHGDGVTKVIDLPFRELQINWNQTDDSQKDFIQNRPVYEDIVDVDYTRLPAFSNSLRTLEKSKDGLYASVKLNLTTISDGQTYNITPITYYYDGEEIYSETWDPISVVAEKNTSTSILLHSDKLVNTNVIKLINTEYDIEIYIRGKLNTVDRVAYNVNYCTYYIGNMFEGDYYASEYIIEGIASQDIISKQLPKNLVETELKFDRYSTKPQSGIAVQEAVGQGVENAILKSKPVVSETLGDGHINIVEDENGSPQMYTEGIGYNEELQTNNKETIVDAINEVNDELNRSIKKISGENLLAHYNEDNNCTLYKISDNDLEDNAPSALYSYNNLTYTTHSYHYKYIHVTTVYDGLIQVYFNVQTDGTMYMDVEHIDFNRSVTRVTYQKCCEQLTNDVNDLQYGTLLVIQNIETKEYICNLLIRTTDNRRIQWNLSTQTYKETTLYPTDCFYYAPTLDSTEKYYCERRWCGPGNNHYPFTVDNEGFIITEPKNTIISGGNTAGGNDWELIQGGRGGGHLTELSENGRMFYMCTTHTNSGWVYNLIDNNGNNIVNNCVSHRISTYKNNIAVINKISNVIYLTLINTDTNEIVSSIPFDINITPSNFIIYNDYIYLFSAKNTYGGKITPINIHLSQSKIGVDISHQYFIKSFNNELFLIKYNNNYNVRPLWIPIKKGLKFNESDPLKPITTINTTNEITGNNIYIENTQNKLDVSLDLTGKNLFDISKLSTTTQKGTNAYIKEVEDSYIIINTPEGSTGNGLVATGVKLKDLCPSLHVGKRYKLNAVTDSTTKTLYLLPLEQGWSIGGSITITEKMLDSEAYFYGLNPKVGQSTGDCKISNIMVTEGIQNYDYEPFFDVNNIELNVRTKNLIDLSTALLNTSTSSGSAVGNPVSFVINNVRSHGNITFNKVMVQPDTQYTLSLDNSRYWLYCMFEMDANDGVVKHYPYYSTLVDNDKVTITTQSNTSYLIIQLHYKYALTVTENELALTKLQLELGDTATEYVPYINETIYCNEYGKFDVPYASSMNLQLTDVTNNIKVSYQKRLNNIYDDIISLQSKLDDICNKYETLLQQFNELKQSNNELSQQNIELNNIISEASDLLGGVE